MALIATAGAADANSYATVAEGDDYHSRRLWTTAWTDASDEDKAYALMQATSLIDAYFTTYPKSWLGAAASETQALCWPRSGMISRNGFAVDSATIPQLLKDAVAEYARQLLVSDRSADSDVEAQGLKSLSAGPVSLSFKDTAKRKVMPDAVVDLVPTSWYYDALTPATGVQFEVL